MIIKNYFLWHYSRAIKHRFIFWKNLLWFFAQFFSLALLLKTLFQPFKRLRDESFIVNAIMRVVGFLLRSFVIILGTITEIIVITIGILELIVWLLMPFLIAPLIVLMPIFYFKKKQPQRMEKSITNFALLRLKNEPHVKKEDMAEAMEWGKNFYEEKQGKSKWWLKENLARIPGIAKDWCYGETYVLDQFSREFMYDKLPYLHFIGHGQQILAIESTLSKTSQANILLVGEPGAGKKTTVQGFVNLLRNGEIHPALEHKRLVELAANTLIASAKTKGELENLLLKIFNDAVKAGNIILVIDDFGKFVKSSQGLGVSISQLLGSYFNSKAIQLIALEDSDVFKRSMEPDSSLMQYFEVIRLEEPGEKELMQILKSTAMILENRQGVIFTYPAIKEIIKVSRRYLTEGALPERAIDILEEVSSRVASQRKMNFITVNDILSFVKEKTKMPVGDLGTGEKEKLINLEEILHKRVVNQEEAISAISSAVRRARMEIQEAKKPIASFLFLGPTGVGKTETAKALAEIYFNNEEAMIRFDMTEYQEESGVERLIGSFKASEPGILATSIREKPYNLILLDEFEKSHRKIEDLFLQILDEGFFTDAFGKKVYMRSSIIIATSNAASQMIWDMVKEGVNPALFKEKIIDFIQRKGSFRAELLNRFDAIIIFCPLTSENLKVIAKIMLEKLKKRLLGKELELIINDSLIGKVAEIGYTPVFGARPMQRMIQDKIEKEIAQRMISGKIKAGDKIEFNSEDLVNL